MVETGHGATLKAAAPAPIRRLPEAAANRIAAGEVIERPASAVRELVENAFDAGATRVDVVIADGGKSLIRVADDGAGIPRDQLALALERHATSKIDGSDLVNIASFGFRGEALPSIGSVARLTIVSRAEAGGDARAETDDGGAWSIETRGGEASAPRPATRGEGTTVEVRDLFSATPARLKFLRADRTETQAIHDALRRLALARPETALTLRDVTGGGEGRQILSVPAHDGGRDAGRGRRVREILGKEFAANAVAVDALRDDLRLTGHAGLPTFSRGAAAAQYLFVNGRPVRDRQLSGALRAAYADLLARDRHPVCALWLDCPAARVDVNVHPAKAEVRFRDPGAVRGLIVSALKHALAREGHRTATTLSVGALGAMRPDARPSGPPRRSAPYAGPRAEYGFRAAHEPPGLAEAPSARVEPDPAPQTEASADAPPDAPPGAFLGAARAQVHEAYIVSQTEDGLVLVDQHAAHERLVYERLKAQTAAQNVARQGLLVPEIVELGDGAGPVLEAAELLADLGLTVEPFGDGAVCVREIPALLGQPDVQRLLRDVADEIGGAAAGEGAGPSGAAEALKSRLDAILARVACHGSIRSGRRMTGDEMNALLREMEATPHSGQCNHGRPTWVKLGLGDIERLFGRR